MEEEKKDFAICKVCGQSSGHYAYQCRNNVKFEKKEAKISDWRPLPKLGLVKSEDKKPYDPVEEDRLKKEQWEKRKQGDEKKRRERSRSREKRDRRRKDRDSGRDKYRHKSSRDKKDRKSRDEKSRERSRSRDRRRSRS